LAVEHPLASTSLEKDWELIGGAAFREKSSRAFC
jgi:hypothetical protein